jgi:hypothetical protein
LRQRHDRIAIDGASDFEQSVRLIDVVPVHDHWSVERRNDDAEGDLRGIVGVANGVAAGRVDKLRKNSNAKSRIGVALRRKEN